MHVAFARMNWKRRRITHPEALSGRFVMIVTKTDSYRVDSTVEHLPRVAGLLTFQSVSVPDTLMVGK